MKPLLFTTILHITAHLLISFAKSINAPCTAASNAQCAISHAPGSAAAAAAAAVAVAYKYARTVQSMA